MYIVLMGECVLVGSSGLKYSLYMSYMYIYIYTYILCKWFTWVSSSFELAVCSSPWAHEFALC